MEQGGAPAANILIIGAGLAGTGALQLAYGLGANITVMDINVKILRDLIERYPGINTMISNSAKEGSIKKIIGMAKEKNIVLQYVDKNKLDEISTSHAHQGVIAQVSEYKYYGLDELIESAKEKSESPFFIILDENNRST